MADHAGDDPGPFARQLRALREAAALTQEELAERSGLTSNGIGALERGERRRPYPHTVRALAAGLGLDEDRRTALAAAARPRTVPAEPGPSPPGHRVPDSAPSPVASAVAATPFYGREAELGDIQRRLANGTRLLTLTGPGGVGKTRLAYAAATVVPSDVADSVAVAELAPVQDPALVLPTIAAALGLPQVGPHDLQTQLASFLDGRRPLLLLDNLEHVLDAAPNLADLLARCPQLVVLATSRAPLRIRAEQELPVAPLILPVGSDPTAVLSSSAGQLFLDRARAAAPAYGLTRESAPVIAEICRRLDGVPLALELAAAHARLLDPSTLLDRLPLVLGVGRSRDLPARQRTMQATLDWSHALLTRQEQLLLRRLAVFAGGFTLPAAERVAGDDLNVLAALTGLVEQSLVVAPSAEGYFRLLEPVRQYAAGLLDDQERSAAGAAHADALVELGAAAGIALWGAEQEAWLGRLEREHANLRAALAWLLEHGEHGRAAQILGDTWLYWALHGHAGEGLSWLDRLPISASSGADRVADGPRSAALVARAGLLYATGDLEGTATAGALAVASARRAGSVSSLGPALVLAATGAAAVGQTAAALTQLTEAESLGSTAGAWIAPHIQLLRGQIQVLGGELDAARASLAEAESLARRLASPFTLATVLNVQASLARQSGGDEEALARFVEAAGLAGGVGISWTLVYTLPGLAELAARAGQPELAVQLFGAGAALAEAAGLVVSYPPDVDAAALGRERARQSVDDSTFARLWEVGRLLPLNSVAALAETIATPLAAPRR